MKKIRRLTARVGHFYSVTRPGHWSVLRKAPPMTLVHILPAPRLPSVDTPEVLPGPPAPVPLLTQETPIVDPKYNKPILYMVAGAILALAAYLGLDLAVVFEGLGNLLGG